MKSYDELLAKALKEIPEDATATDRFEMPKIQAFVQGNKTIIQNFTQICTALSRKPLHLQKFLLRELAAPGEAFKNTLRIGSAVRKDKLEQKLEDYVTKFVLCPECNKPDTKLERDDRGVVKKKCTACGHIAVIN